MLPGDAESDEGFRQELLQQSHSGLRAVAGITAVAAAFLAVGRWLVLPENPGNRIAFATNGIVIFLAIVAYAFSRIERAYPSSRLIAILTAEIVAAALIGASLYLETFDMVAETFIPGQMTLAVLLIVVAVPLQPIHALIHGAIVTLLYVADIRLAAATFLPGTTIRLEYVLFMATLTLLATGLAAVLYAQRRSAYFAYLQTLQAADEVRKAQQRLALSESASSMARLSAAISHELNTPIGALKSAVDTLLLLGSRQAAATPEEVPRLLRLQADLRKSIQDSAGRLQEIASRVARFTNLDQADIQEISVNDLIEDVVRLLRPRMKAGNELKLNLAPVSKIVANPQRLSSVFFDLINNSVGALNGTGRVDVGTQQQATGIEVVIADNGRGIERDRLLTIFEPGFQETSGRVATGNWSMFNARQTLREQGGDIRIESREGQGTTVTVSLPFGVVT